MKLLHSRSLTKLLESVIKSVYVEFRIPADKIVVDPELSQQFTHKVNSKLPPDQQVDVLTVNEHLLRLRKRGAENGGLPRLVRRYNGRQVKPR